MRLCRMKLNLLIIVSLATLVSASKNCYQQLALIDGPKPTDAEGALGHLTAVAYLVSAKCRHAVLDQRRKGTDAVFSAKGRIQYMARKLLPLNEDELATNRLRTLYLAMTNVLSAMLRATSENDFKYIFGLTDKITNVITHMEGGAEKKDWLGEIIQRAVDKDDSFSTPDFKVVFNGDSIEGTGVTELTKGAEAAMGLSKQIRKYVDDLSVVTQDAIVSLDKPVAPERLGDTLPDDPSLKSILEGAKEISNSHEKDLIKHEDTERKFQGEITESSLALKLKIGDAEEEKIVPCDRINRLDVKERVEPKSIPYECINVMRNEVLRAFTDSQVEEFSEDVFKNMSQRVLSVLYENKTLGKVNLSKFSQIGFVEPSVCSAFELKRSLINALGDNVKLSDKCLLEAPAWAHLIVKATKSRVPQEILKEFNPAVIAENIPVLKEADLGNYWSHADRNICMQLTPAVLQEIPYLNKYLNCSELNPSLIVVEEQAGVIKKHVEEITKNGTHETVTREALKKIIEKSDVKVVDALTSGGEYCGLLSSLASELPKTKAILFLNCDGFYLRNLTADHVSYIAQTKELCGRVTIGQVIGMGAERFFNSLGSECYELVQPDVLALIDTVPTVMSNIKWTKITKEQLEALSGNIIKSIYKKLSKTRLWQITQTQIEVAFDHDTTKLKEFEEYRLKNPKPVEKKEGEKPAGGDGGKPEGEKPGEKA